MFKCLGAYVSTCQVKDVRCQVQGVCAGSLANPKSNIVNLKSCYIVRRVGQFASVTVLFVLNYLSAFFDNFSILFFGEDEWEKII